MEGEECAADDPLTCAQKAIIAALTVIRDNPAVGWHMGRGTGTFGLLTEAFAKLIGRADLGQVRKEWSPRAAADPAEGKPLGRMTFGHFSNLMDSLAGAVGTLKRVADRETSAATVESHITRISEDCGLSPSAVRLIAHISSQEL